MNIFELPDFLKNDLKLLDAQKIGELMLQLPGFVDRHYGHGIFALSRTDRHTWTFVAYGADPATPKPQIRIQANSLYGLLHEAIDKLSGPDSPKNGPSLPGH